MFLCCLSRSVFWEIGTKQGPSQGFRLERLEGYQGRGQIQLLGQEAGSHRRKWSLSWPGRKMKAARGSFLNRLGTEARNWTQIRKSNSESGTPTMFPAYGQKWVGE